MLKCGDCGTVLRDDSQACGVCGSTSLHRAERISQPSGSKGSSRHRLRRALAILVLTGSAAFFIGGFTIIVLPVNGVLQVTGMLMLLFGGVILAMAASGTGGMFRYRSGLRHSGESMEKADREGKKHEQEDAAD